MGIFADEERSRDSFFFAIFTNRLRDGHNVVFGKAGVERTSAMPRGAEGDALVGVGDVGLGFVIKANKFGDID